MLIYSANSFNQKQEIINLSNHLKNIITKDTVFVCVGTDKIIFDSIGPLVGHILKKHFPNIFIYGDLENPITSLNLSSELNKIKTKHKDNLIFTIDASLDNNVGYVNLLNEPLCPSYGKFKFGDYKLIGIIDTNDNPDPLHSKIRLYNVFLLVDLISQSIIKTLEELN